MTNITTIPEELHDETRLTTHQLAALTNISRQTYEGWRCRKDGGPPFEKLGPQIIRYRWGDVCEWIAKNTASQDSYRRRPWESSSSSAA